MQSLSLHQHSLLIENSNIPYLSPSGSAEILPATRKVMIVLTPLQRRDAYCRARCAKCTVQAVRDARSITLYRDRLSRQSSGYVLWSCRGSRAIPLGCPGFMAWKKQGLAIQQKSTKALHSKTRCAMIVHKDIWWYSEFSNASVIVMYHMSRQSWSGYFRDSQ